MKTPNSNHLDTITRAQNHLEFDVDCTSNSPLKKRLQSDVKRLCEIREMLLLIIENPTLPFAVIESETAGPGLNVISEEPDQAF